MFHADNAQRVYIQSRSLYLTGDGTIVSSASMGAGTIYTVVSADSTATPEQLRDATAPVPATTGEQSQALTPAGPLPPAPASLPAGGGPGPADHRGHRGQRVADPETYDKVEAIESWMADHIKYTTDIPPLAPGADAVTSFLFGSRLGYCEQISTATVVMLRSLGIPARETVGYVPGTYDPITDLYDVEAKDAHAWVQVWFPGYGWQSFDPTADVPLANPRPGSVLAGTAGRTLAHLPWIPIGIAAASAAVAEIRRRRRRRPPTWAHRIAADLERRRGQVGPAPTDRRAVSAYGLRLADGDPARRPGSIGSTQLVERCTYGGLEPSAGQIASALAFTRGYRPGPPAKAHRAARLRTGPRPAPRRTRPRRPAAGGRPSAGGAG